MLFIARRHFVRRDHGQSRRGEGKNEKQRCEKAKILVPLVHSSPPVDLLYLLLFSVRAPPSYASPPRTILRTAQSAAVALEPLGDGKRILEPGIGKIVDDHLRHRLEQLELVALFSNPEHDHSLQRRTAGECTGDLRNGDRRLFRKLETLSRPRLHALDGLETFRSLLGQTQHRISLA